MKKLFSTAVMLTALTLSAENLFTLSAPQDFNTPQKLTAAGDALETAAPGWFMSMKQMEIDPAKTYRIEGEFRTAPGKTVKGKLSIGFYGLDKDGHVIQVTSVNAAAGSETELAAPVNAADTVLKIKDGSKWQNQGYVAYDVDPSGKQRDLPCKTVLNAITKTVKKNGAVYEVTLAQPAGKNLAAGVAVRQHLPGWSFLSSERVDITDGWRKISWTVKPGAEKKNTRHQWLFGSKKFICVIVAPAGVQFRGVTVSAEDK